jgi:light-regulated signal transduction histidine kinase (bacteriophytochrome)
MRERSESAMGSENHQSLARFASDAAHELIGPIDQMSTLVALFVSRYSDPADEEAATLLSHIQAAGKRMQHAAAGLRAYFRVASAPHRRESVDMNLALQTAQYLLAREIDETGASITAGELPQVIGDADLLAELFRILLENSLKFRRPSIPPEIHITADVSESGSEFSVADNGCGIDPKYRDLAFIPFKRLTSCGVPTAGMGLAIARTIMEIHDGSIEVRDSGDEGTLISFSFPPQT